MRAPTRIVATAVSLAVGLTLVTPAAPAGERRAALPEQRSAQARDADALDEGLERGDLSPAEYALQRARSLSTLGRVRARFGQVHRPDPRGATLILRELALRKNELKGSDRRSAERILARPTDNTGGEINEGWGYGAAPVSTHCEAGFCVHWTETGKHRVPLEEVGGDPSIPDWVETVIATMTNVLAGTHTTLGYQNVKSDITSSENGGNALPDIYLVDVGSDGLFGYCSSDDPDIDAPGYPGGDMSAYCVLDNDYVGFNQGPLASLRVTAAHEYFHAVQFSYDFFEDRWWMEATATWIEDVLYDAINDNYYFLSVSAIQYPDAPLDFVTYNFNNPLSGLQYGQWLFFRYLTERLGLSGDPDEDLIRAFWERAADRNGLGDPNDYSVKAIRRILGDRGFDLGDLFADFSAGNWDLPGNYEEGSAYKSFLRSNKLGHRPWLVAKHGIRSSKPKTGNKTLKLFHLSSMHVKFIPKRGVKRSAKLLLKVDGPSAVKSPKARYVILKRSGAVKTGEISLNGRGNGKKRVTFGKKRVKWVVLVLVNASTRYKNCGTFGNFACEGESRDDNAKFVYKGALKQ